MQISICPQFLHGQRRAWSCSQIKNPASSASSVISPFLILPQIFPRIRESLPELPEFPELLGFPELLELPGLLDLPGLLLMDPVYHNFFSTASRTGSLSGPPVRVTSLFRRFFPVNFMLMALCLQDHTRVPGSASALLRLPRCNAWPDFIIGLRGL